MATIRAPRIAAPGAQRVTLTGIMAVSDDYGRARLLILDERPNGVADSSWGVLQNAVPRVHADYQPPYEVCVGSASDGVRGTVWFVLPAHRRAHWLEVAKNLRGQWVTVEATVRPFMIPGREPSGGASLDLAMLTPLRNI